MKHLVHSLDKPKIKELLALKADARDRLIDEYQRLYGAILEFRMLGLKHEHYSKESTRLGQVGMALHVMDGGRPDDDLIIVNLTRRGDQEQHAYSRQLPNVLHL